MVIDAVDQDDVMVASPSIVRLETGRLLVVHEVVPRHSVSAEASSKKVRCSCTVSASQPVALEPSEHGVRSVRHHLG